jgi:hypothetical protein
MTEDNRIKEEAKKQRNFWTCPRPVTKVLRNAKAYNRAKDRKDKRLYEEDVEDAVEER